ncbi:uncharacterized protein LOC115245901 [Formica exsecta]|uniref:uncharacterized protein LOC115245901 n=1 Tax=Formica exsecta TaxID=72781 RepID=UPI0011422ABD|nr:uncharacterized protein LOC115245901 [Formica exsecta]
MLLPQTLRSGGTQMHPTLHVQEAKKRGKQSLRAANDDDIEPRRLYIKDQKSKITFLIDTGSDISVYPRRFMQGNQQIQPFDLFAANGTRIVTYGMITLQPNLGLRQAFPWRFTVADVAQPIIGSDFLAQYHLLPNVKNRKLIDGKTGLSTPGTATYSEVTSIKVVKEETHYHRIIAEFPGITQPAGAQRIAKHNTEHHIATTPGQPEASRPRRLAPDKLQAAKAKFDLLLQEGIIRPSKSPWCLKKRITGNHAETTAN